MVLACSRLARMPLEMVSKTRVTSSSLHSLSTSYLISLYYKLCSVYVGSQKRTLQ
ncbi:unnamed protein product, partial [Nesidiocoris tenuis]